MQLVNSDLNIEKFATAVREQLRTLVTDDLKDIKSLMRAISLGGGGGGR